jgi:hypothetical protein
MHEGAGTSGPFSFVYECCRRDAAGDLSAEPEPPAPAPRLARPGRRRRQLARERRRLSVHRHLPAQRARDLLRARRPGAVRRRRRQPRRRLHRRPDRRPNRRPEHAAARARASGSGVRVVSSDPRRLACVSAARDRRCRHRVLLARPVDDAVAAHSRGATAFDLRAAADQHEPRPGARRPRRRADRDDRAPEQLHHPVPPRCSDVSRLHRRALDRAGACGRGRAAPRGSWRVRAGAARPQLHEPRRVERRLRRRRL